MRKAPEDFARQETEGLLRAINKACGIIELGDQRLLASDGPPNDQPPDLSLTEWRELYCVLDAARMSLMEEIVERGVPRRNRLDLFTPAERVIHDAVAVVEAAGAHPRLTDAVIMLGKAREAVADFVDASPRAEGVHP